MVPAVLPVADADGKFRSTDPALCSHQAEDRNPPEAVFSRIPTWREQWCRKDTISDVLPFHGEGENKEKKISLNPETF